MRCSGACALRAVQVQGTTLIFDVAFAANDTTVTHSTQNTFQPEQRYQLERSAAGFHVHGEINLLSG